MEHEASKEKVKMQLNSACHNIELYVTACKQEFWSTSIDMPRHQCLKATTIRSVEILASGYSPMDVSSYRTT